MSNRTTQYIHVNQFLNTCSFYSRRPALIKYVLPCRQRWRIVALLCHILDDELSCWTFLHATWTLVFLCFNQLLIDDMWWSKLNKINHLCCCNEKDSFFLFFRGHAFILLWWRHGWIGWASHISRGREINIMPDFSSAMSGYQLKSNCFTPPSWLQDMCYFKLNLQGPKVIYLCQNGGRMEFWETTINSLWM